MLTGLKLLIPLCGYTKKTYLCGAKSFSMDGMALDYFSIL